MQTRSADAFLTWLLPKLPLQKSGEKQGGFTLKLG
jgi:hypothetical protein